ncbi:fimbria/pilus outer membrane usher protein [Escherichia coli]
MTASPGSSRTTASTHKPGTKRNGGDDSNEISGNCTVGVNLGPWRMRADWQTNHQHTRSNDDDEFSGDETQKKWEWSRYYAWRALPSLKAKLALGEDHQIRYF